MTRPSCYIIAASFVLLLGCHVQVQHRSERQFIVNGREVEVTESLLAEFRSAWMRPIEIVTRLPKSDAQWTMDYIAIASYLNHTKCRSLIHRGIRQLQGLTHSFEGRSIRGGHVDEAWTIQTCGKDVYYRVVVPEGEYVLIVYEVPPGAL